MSSRSILAVSLLLALSTPAWSAKPAETQRVPEIGVTAEAASSIDAVGRRAADGRVLAVYQPDYRAKAGDPEAMARDYLAARGAQLGLRDSAAARMAMTHTSTLGNLHVVRFTQMQQGLPVWDSDTAISVGLDGQVLFVANGVRSEVSRVDTTATITSAAAIEQARAWATTQAAAQFEQATLMILAEPEAAAQLVWRVQLATGDSPYRELEVLIDAHQGGIVRAEDRTLHLDAPGKAFNPDPLSTALKRYTETGYGDNSDADSPQLIAQIQSVTIREITQNGANFELKGPWASCLDHESPFSSNDCPVFSSADFTVNSRSDDRYEPVHVYYHIDTYMRYLNETLGLTVHPPYAGGVIYDAHGLSNADNSHFVGSTSRLAFGDGGVDDAEDADVVIHELGHGVHYWLTNGGLSNVNGDGLSEGLGDYLAMSYSRSFNHWPSTDPEYFWMFSWDGHNTFWAGRVTNYHLTHSFAAGNLGTGSPHAPGQYWASCNMLNYDSLGRQVADRAVLMGIAMTNSSSRQNDAAQAVLNAAAVNYPPNVVDALFSNYTTGGTTSPYSACTYNVTRPATPSMFRDGFEQ